MAVLRWTPFVLALAAASSGTCHKAPNGNGSGNGVEALSSAAATLPGVDSSELTPREQRTWYRYVSELLAPCPDVAVPVAECVREKRPCAACGPAAEFVLRQVRAGKPKSDVVQLYEARFDPDTVRTIVLANSPILGPADAVVTIVEWADFECPACGSVSEVLYELQERYSDKVRMVFKQYPLSYHPTAKLASQACYAAQLQGKFWPMHKLLFEHPSDHTETDLIGYARDLGLDEARFVGDMKSDAAREHVEREKRQGEGVGVSGTPSVYVNGRYVPFHVLTDPVGELERWIELELKLHAAQGGKP